jgi:hypothetical protein
MPDRPDAATWRVAQVREWVGAHCGAPPDANTTVSLLTLIDTLHAQAVARYQDALKAIRDGVRKDSDLRAMRITHLVNQALGEPDDSELHRFGPGFTRPT